MSNNIIDKIQLSGVTYDIGGQGGSGVSVVEVTQAEYDALPSSAKTDTSKMYVITDAEAGDLTNYYTKTETNTLLGGKADTATTYTKTEVDNAITAATSTKQDTLVSGTNIKTINNESLLGSGNIDIQGGGKAIEAGRGISITTGETADTVSFNLPISAGTGTNSIKCGETDGASGIDSFAIGANGVYASGVSSFAGGSYSEAKGAFSMAFGRYNTANNYGEVALGFFNKSNGSSSAAGNSSGNTLFSVGNGTNSFSNTRHNAFEIRQNGDIYITSGNTDIKLQDHLGGGGGGKAIEAGRGISVTTGETADTVSFNLPISAGTGVDSITEGDRTTASGDYSHTEGGYSTANGNYSHAEGMATITYGMSSHAEGYVTEARNKYEHASGAYNVSSSATTEFGHSGNTLFSVGNGTSSSAKHNAFEIRQNGDIYITKDGQDVKLQDQLGGGGGGSSYTAGDGIDITNNVISVTGKVDTTTYNTYTAATDTALASKQTTLTAGTGISIIDNVISATGGGGGGKAIEAGTNISVTTGETADTINCTLPITVRKNGNQNEITFNNVTKFNVRGYADGAYAVAIGDQTTSYGSYAIAIGYGARTNVNFSNAFGYYSIANNQREFSTGSFNNSVTATTTFGDSGNTLFSVGNGTSSSARHNAFEIRQNGDIYCSDGTNDVKLQDTITATAANTTALGGLKLVKLTQAEYDALATKDSNTLYVIVN